MTQDFTVIFNKAKAKGPTGDEIAEKPIETAVLFRGLKEKCEACGLLVDE